MKEKKNDIEIKYSTFNNFNINKKKSDISSKIKQMNITEYNNIKIFTTSFIPSYIKNSNNNTLIKNKFGKLSNKNIIPFPLQKRNSLILKKSNNKINLFNSTQLFPDTRSKILMSTNKKNNNKKKVQISLDKNIKLKDRPNINNLIGEYDKKYLTIETFKKHINNFKVKSNLININSTTNNLSTKFKTINNSNKNKIKMIKTQSQKNKIIKKSNNITIPQDKYYITTNALTSEFYPKQSNKNKIIDFLNISKNNVKLKNIKSFNFKKTNFKSPNRNYNYTKTTSNSLDEINNKDLKKVRNLNKIKNIYKNINYWKLLEIENNLNNAYNEKFIELNEKHKIIQKIKKKCKIILEELDKKNNLEIQHIIKEIKEQLLGLGFKEFYNYLLTILKNYDKKIVDWSFDIVEEKNECPEDLKLKNVRHRHQKFMGLLDRQYICGINANNHMDYLIRNSKNKLGFNNNDNYDRYIFNEKNNNNIKNQNNFIKSIFTENNYNSKFYEKFLRKKII